jgi:hypothetical protein
MLIRLLNHLTRIFHESLAATTDTNALAILARSDTDGTKYNTARNISIIICAITAATITEVAVTKPFTKKKRVGSENCIGRTFPLSFEEYWGHPSHVNILPELLFTENHKVNMSQTLTFSTEAAYILMSVTVAVRSSQP